MTYFVTLKSAKSKTNTPFVSVSKTKMHLEEKEIRICMYIYIYIMSFKLTISCTSYGDTKKYGLIPKATGISIGLDVMFIVKTLENGMIIIKKKTLPISSRANGIQL